MAAVERPPPEQDITIQTDHTPTITTSPLQCAITSDLSNLKISTDDTRGLPHAKPSTDRSDDRAKVSLPANEVEQTKQCNNCGTDNAKAYCAGCHQAPNTDGSPHNSVRYCNKECQKADWPTHRTECKNLQARKALFRAAWLLQKIWYTVRRESFDNDIVRTEEVDGELLIHEGNYDPESTKRKYGFYREVPDAIFKNKQDAEACLNLLYCTDSLSFMYIVNSWLLKGICVDIKEVKLKVSKPSRKARYVGREWSQEFLHEVLQARLHSGEVYAIDLTGAQYGWYKPITQWRKFSMSCNEITRVTQFGVDGRNPLGSAARSLLFGTFFDPWDDRPDLRRAIPMFNECLKREFNKVFIQQIVSKHPRGLDLLRLPAPAFEVIEKDILSKTKQITYDAVEKVDALVSVIGSEARMCNKEMRKTPNPDIGAILKQGVTKLAALFNGKWERDAFTGRLNSVSLKQFMEDEEYAEKYMDGVLPEQKLWGDITFDHGMRSL